MRSAQASSVIAVHCAVSQDCIPSTVCARRLQVTNLGSAVRHALTDTQPFSGSPDMKVLFCGEELCYSYIYTAEALQNDQGIQVRDPTLPIARLILFLECKCLESFQVMRCPQCEVPSHIQGADVAVPLMCKLDAQLLRTAKRLKLIIQYGVGVEGIDIPVV